MFNRQINLIRLEISISPRGPLLIRSGRTGLDPSRPQLECVRTSVAGRPTVYIPGSSLKGVLRAHAERLLRAEGLVIPDPFDRNSQQAFHQKASFADVFAGTSPIGRTFGTLHLRGSMAISDCVPGAFEAPESVQRAAALAIANATEQRNNVAIDRLMGSAKGTALFDQEVVVGGSFEGQIVLRNVQLYQVALLLFTLRDLDDGLIQLGSGTTRGNGLVAAKIRQIVFEHPRGRCSDRRLSGLSALQPGLSDLFPGDYVEIAPEIDFRKGSRLIQDQWTFSAEAIPLLEEALVAGPWTQFAAAAGGRAWIA